MDYYFLDRELFFISKISKEIGNLIKVLIIDNKSHGNCYNNCIESGEKTINGFYIILNTKFGVYEFIRHSIIKKQNEYFDITDPGHKVNFLYFIETDKEFYDLPIKMFYNKTFITDYSLLKNGDYYVYGLFDKTKKEPFYIGKGLGDRANTHLTESSLKKDTNLHKKSTIKKIGVNNILIKKRYNNILDGYFAYDLEELTIENVGLENLTNICKNASPPNFKGKVYEEIMGAEQATILKQKKSELQLIAGGYGPKFHSEETKLKMSLDRRGEGNAMFGKKHSDESKQKMSNIKKGKKYSGETNKKKGRSGKENGNFGPQEKIECPHCLKIGGKAIMKRWHFDKCKKIKRKYNA